MEGFDPFPLTSVLILFPRCFARALRKYLALKAEMYGIKAEAEVELLSLLDTADIRAVGAEIFLTWGGAVLTEITHPQVSLIIGRYVIMKSYFILVFLLRFKFF